MSSKNNQPKKKKSKLKKAQTVIKIFSLLSMLPFGWFIAAFLVIVPLLIVIVLPVFFNFSDSDSSSPDSITSGLSTAPPVNAPSCNSGDVNKIIQGAVDLKNSGKIQYVFGGHDTTDPEWGLDCSSFTEYVYKTYGGLKIGGTTLDQVNRNQRISDDDIQPGDLVFLQNTYRKGVSHVGIYIGNDRVIHNASEDEDVIESKLSDWKKATTTKYGGVLPKWYGAYRVEGLNMQTTCEPPPTTPPDTGLPNPYKGDYYFPLKTGKFTSPQGVRPNPTGSGIQFHAGLDIAAPTGTPLYAIAPGKVVAMTKKDKTDYGYMVMIEHNVNGKKFISLYGHMTKNPPMKVKMGDTVQIGQNIGFVGSTGDSSGPHLHLEIRTSVGVSPTKRNPGTNPLSLFNCTYAHYKSIAPCVTK